MLGAGWIAGLHAAELDAMPSVQLVAVGDPDPARAHALAGPRRANVYPDWQTMFDVEPLDAVWICTPPLAHRAPTVAALAAGVHVYLEKPIARTLPDARAIVDAAAASHAVCAVGYQWHASELLERAREAMVGQSIATMVGRNYGPVPARPWFLQRAEGGGQLLERGSHHVDLQRALGGEVEAVSAVATNLPIPPHAEAGDIEDTVLTTLHFTSGAIGSIVVAWTADGQPEHYSMDVIAHEATLFVELGPEAFRIAGSHGAGRLNAAYEDPFRRSIERFLTAVSTGGPGRGFCTPTDALQTLGVVQACERALATGHRVPVAAGDSHQPKPLSVTEPERQGQRGSRT
jgi:myo-inositol 2-dehydrogenase/D-chiro-inositol 1-dehydrogenase